MRLSEQSRASEAPFLSAYLSSSGLIANLEANTIAINPKPDSLQASIRAVYATLKQIREYGFTNTELERVKANYRTMLQQQLKEYDKTSSERFMNEILGHYLDNDLATSFEFLQPILLQAVNELSLNDTLVYQKEFQSNENRDMMLLHPKDAKEVPQEEQINAWLSDARQQAVTPYKEEATETSLLSSLPRIY